MNQTLPGMLKRMIDENPKEWDCLLQKAVRTIDHQLIPPQIHTIQIDVRQGDALAN